MITDIGIDLDGVGYPFTKAFTEYATRVLDRDDLPEARTWEFYELWGLSYSEFQKMIVRGTQEANLFSQYPPDPYFLEMLKKLSAHNFKLHIVTNRPVEAQEQTAEWLKKHAVPHNSLLFTPDKTDLVGHVMSRYTGGMPANYEIAMIEDYHENFKALQNAGVIAYLYDQPWNRHHSTNKRVVLLSDFIDAVITYNRNPRRQKVKA